MSLWFAGDTCILWNAAAIFNFFLMVCLNFHTVLQYVYNVFHAVLGHGRVMFDYSASVRLIIEVTKISKNNAGVLQQCFGIDPPPRSVLCCKCHIMCYKLWKSEDTKKTDTKSNAQMKTNVNPSSALSSAPNADVVTVRKIWCRDLWVVLQNKIY